MTSERSKCRDFLALVFISKSKLLVLFSIQKFIFIMLNLANFRQLVAIFLRSVFDTYTAVSRKVVQKKHKSVRDNAERHYGKLSV